MNKYLIASAAIAALAVPALAQMAMPDVPDERPAATTRAEAEAKMREHFAKLDGNRDGFVTREEVHASMETMMAAKSGEHFDRMDADRNGSISREEFDAAHKPGAMHTMRRPHDGAGKDPSQIRMLMRHGEGGADKAPGEHKMLMMRHHGGGAGKGFMMLKMADADKDGRVSLQEAINGSLTMFDKADANKDGTLTPEERKAARQAMRAEWKAKRGS